MHVAAETGVEVEEVADEKGVEFESAGSLEGDIGVVPPSESFGVERTGGVVVVGAEVGVQ